jgi:hypothetical protein
MNIKQMMKEAIIEMLNDDNETNKPTIEQSNSFDNGMIGKYVIVRCRDAGVHAGVLKCHNGRECVLEESRRLWYWKVKGSGDFLSAIALSGVHEDSKLGAEITVHLTENCEIIICTKEAEKSIRTQAVYNG